MPLRDHFRPPLDNKHSWDELHGGWPMVIVQYLYSRLPRGFVAAPGVHLGGSFEVDVSAYEEDAPSSASPRAEGNGGVATQVWAPPAPTCSLNVELPAQDEYEVRIYDVQRGRRLVAAIEIVSPSNKDRPESRLAFQSKVLALVRKNVCVSIVDVVTVRQRNFFADVLDLLEHVETPWSGKPPHLYVATLRNRKQRKQPPVLDTWFYPLELGKPLPTLHLWLADSLGVTVDLESTYEDTCRVLRIA